MTCSLLHRLKKVSLSCHKILQLEKRFYILQKVVPTKELSSNFSSRFYGDKYEEIRSRLAAIPISYLLHNGLHRFQNDLFYEKDERLDELLKWCSKVFNYNTRNSSLFIADVLLKAYCTYGFSMTDKTWNQWDSEGWKSAVTLAWCVETVLTYIIMLDDIVDQSYLRRGQQCWNKRPEVGLSAIHDSLVLSWSIFKVLRKYFADTKCYINLLHEFYQANLEVSFGQCVDSNIKINEKTSLSAFSFEKYKTLADYKSGYWFFKLPVHLAIHLTGSFSEKDFDFTKRLCQEIGLYFQSQNDTYDYAYSIEQSGLKGNDIRKGRLTWLSAKFFEVATVSMKKEFLENYGVDNEDAVNKIFELYFEINMAERFKEFEDQLYTEISTLIESKNDIKGALFYDLFHQIRIRKKFSQKK